MITCHLDLLRNEASYSVIPDKPTQILNPHYSLIPDVLNLKDVLNLYL